MNKKNICVEGNIGAGKTTLAKRLAEHYHASLMLENFENNPYLKHFYQDLSKYALQLELSFLADRFKQQKEFLYFDKNIVSDYLFDKSLIFANINLSKEELAIFKAAFLEAKKQTLRPDVIIFLDAQEELLEKNIKKRGRNFEENIPTAYLQKITNSYYSYLKNQNEYPIIWVNVNEYDLLLNNGHFNRLINKIDSLQEAQIYFL